MSVPRLYGVRSSEEADELGRRANVIDLLEPALAVGLPVQYVKGKMND